MPGDLGEREPPDPIPNSEVKLLSADDSVGFPHAKVGHRQALNKRPLTPMCQGPFICGETRGMVLPSHAFPDVTSRIV